MLVRDEAIGSNPPAALVAYRACAAGEGVVGTHARPGVSSLRVELSDGVEAADGGARQRLPPRTTASQSPVLVGDNPDPPGKVVKLILLEL